MMALRARELRTIRIALTVSLGSLIVAYGIVPYVALWRSREELIAARRDEMGRLRMAIQKVPAMRVRLAGAQALSAAAPRKVLSARTSPLAASELQATLQRLAAEAPLSVSSLDVSGEPDSTHANALPASFSAVGDVRAVSAFLAAVRRGPYVIEVSDLRLRPNPSLLGQPLQLTLSLHAPWVQEPIR